MAEEYKLWQGVQGEELSCRSPNHEGSSWGAVTATGAEQHTMCNPLGATRKLWQQQEGTWKLNE